MSKQYVIVIGRHFGSGGRQIGVQLSEKLGIPLYDKSILGRVAEEQGVSDERLRKMDEYLNGNRFQNIGLQVGKVSPDMEDCKSVVVLGLASFL